MAATRAATEAELVEAARPRLAAMLACGTTTAEVKSGYGLTPASEITQLRAIRTLAATQPIELAGVLLAAVATLGFGLVLGPEAPLIALGRARSLAWVVTGFVLFRLYDIWKPGPVRWLEENLSGGAGVVMDDVLAGVLGALTLTALVLVVDR